MANLYLTEQNSVLRKKGNRLIVQNDEAILLAVQCHKIDSVLIFGNVQFTTQAVHELLEHGIDLSILSRTGRLKGQISCPSAKNITLRVAQFQKYDDHRFRMDLSKKIVAGKIRNSLNFVRNFSYNHPEIGFRPETDELKELIRSAESADGVGRLTGFEGRAAAVYFSAFGRMMLGEFEFRKRKRRPPTDPVNAMLSLTYTMLFNEIASFLGAMGLDPYLGYYHKIDYGRASLASDLLEEFRAPAGDRLTLNLVNNRIFKKEDFYVNFENSGVYFRRDALKRYFAEYEKLLNREFIHLERDEKTTLRKCFRIQAEKMAATIRGDTEYTPFES